MDGPRRWVFRPPADDWRRLARRAVLRRAAVGVPAATLLVLAFAAVLPGPLLLRALLAVALFALVAVLLIRGWRRAGSDPRSFPRGEWTVEADGRGLRVRHPLGELWLRWEGLAARPADRWVRVTAEGRDLLAIPRDALGPDGEAWLLARAGRPSEGPLPAAPPPGCDTYRLAIAPVAADVRAVTRGPVTRLLRGVLVLLPVAIALNGLLLLTGPTPAGVPLLGFAAALWLGMLAAGGWGARRHARWLGQAEVGFGPDGVWLLTRRGASVVRWARIRAIVRARDHVGVVGEGLLLPIPDRAIPARVNPDALARALEEWRSAAVVPEEPGPARAGEPPRDNPYAAPGDTAAR